MTAAGLVKAAILVMDFADLADLADRV